MVYGGVIVRTATNFRMGLQFAKQFLQPGESAIVTLSPFTYHDLEQGIEIERPIN